MLKKKAATGKIESAMNIHDIESVIDSLPLKFMFNSRQKKAIIPLISHLYAKKYSEIEIYSIIGYTNSSDRIFGLYTVTQLPVNAFSEIVELMIWMEKELSQTEKPEKFVIEALPRIIGELTYFTYEDDYGPSRAGFASLTNSEYVHELIEIPKEYIKRVKPHKKGYIGMWENSLASLIGEVEEDPSRKGKDYVGFVSLELLDVPISMIRKLKDILITQIRTEKDIKVLERRIVRWAPLIGVYVNYGKHWAGLAANFLYPGRDIEPSVETLELMLRDKTYIRMQNPQRELGLLEKSKPPKRPFLLGPMEELMVNLRTGGLDEILQKIREMLGGAREPGSVPPINDAAISVGMAYYTLELPINDSFENVRKRYRALAKKHHPDLLPGTATKSEKIAAELKMSELNDAYEILKTYLQRLKKKKKKQKKDQDSEKDTEKDTPILLLKG